MTELFADDSKGAEFSECGKYRYKLWRKWDDTLPLVMCIGLNPSTANGNKNDPTIGILTRMLTHLGYGGFYMMNLFGYISSKPDDLATVENPLGDNDSKMAEVEALCDDVIVCWGSFKQAEMRAKEVLVRYPQAKCFGVNSGGAPMHPMGMMYNGQQGNPILYLYSDLLP